MGDQASRRLAVVVTYNPGDGLARNLEALRAQGDVVVVDNGSVEAAALERTVNAARCRWLPNGTNLGLAGALNLAAAVAREEGFDWLATFDQDSFVSPGSLDLLFGVLATHPKSTDVAIVSLCHVDAATGRDLGQPAWQVIEDAPAWRSVRSTITSGCLVRLSHLARVGDFDDRLFIDAVDHEVCLRLRTAGFLLIEAKAVYMHHPIGAGTEHSLFGRRLVCTNHPPARQYYITRNLLELVRRSWNLDRDWARHMASHLLSGVVRVMLFERERLAKAAAMSMGLRDFALRRFGPRSLQRA